MFQSKGGLRWLMICVQIWKFVAQHHHTHHHHMIPSWIVKMPENLETFSTGSLLDVRNNSEEMKIQATCSTNNMWKVDIYTDGEVVDALEHFFWGKKDGLALELGALDGSPHTHSMTYALQESLGWDRILIEANPLYRLDTIKNSPLALSINAAICNKPDKIHYVHHDYTSGIVEFMTPSFLKEFHEQIYNSGVPPGNVTNIPWSFFSNVKEVECIPLSKVFHFFKIHHINFFILDVEGGELSILESIDWKRIIFDIVCIETDPIHRPEGYAQKVIGYMEARGYKAVTGQLGRNIWFAHKDFVPSLRPGLDKECFNGFRKFDNTYHWYSNPKYPKFQPCPISET